MKSYLKIFLLLLFLSLLAGCKADKEKATAGDMDKVFTCPMHPKVVSNKPGDCPDCGMFLVEASGTSANMTSHEEKPEKTRVRKARKKEAAAEGISYVCSMHPQVIRNQPGDCPICGMFLIELIAEDENSFDSSLVDIVLSVNESVIASVKNIYPEKREMPVIIEAAGRLNYDPRSIRTISAAYAGTVEESFVKYQYQFIKKGQKIFRIHSPYIYNERWQYVRLIQTYPDRDDLTAEALSWFRILGLTQGQIDSLKRAPKPDYHLNVYSPADGYAVGADSEEGAGSGIGLRDGITVATGDPLFKLIDVRSLQADLKVKTENVPLLKRGQKVLIADVSDPEVKYDAIVDQVEPLNNNLFQSVRVYIKDNNRRLGPGRQISAAIMTGTREALWIPASAVIDLGERQITFVMSGGRYVATEIRTGLRSEDKIEVKSGIDENTTIAEKALLLLDSDGFISLNN